MSATTECQLDEHMICSNIHCNNHFSFLLSTVVINCVKYKLSYSCSYKCQEVAKYGKLPSMKELYSDLDSKSR